MNTKVLKSFLVSAVSAAVLNCSAYLLPGGYTELDYIESDYGQRLHTHVRSAPEGGTVGDTLLEYDIITKEVDPGARFPIVGSWFWPDEGNGCYMIASCYGRFTYIDGENVDLGPCNPNTHYRVRLTGNQAIVEDVDAGTATTNTVDLTDEVGEPIYAFADYERQHWSSFKLKSLRISQRGELLRDYVPCRTIVDGETKVGFYDRVNKELCESDASAFIAGPDAGGDERSVKLVSLGSWLPDDCDYTSGGLEELQANIARYEAEAPFDGVVLHLGPCHEVFSGVPLGEDEAAAVEAAIGIAQETDFRRWKFNFLGVMIDQNVPDWFNDGYWSVVVANWTRAANAARRAGLVGISFDSEGYGVSPMNAYWTSDWWLENHPESGYTAEEYVAKARARGRAVAEAVFAEYPSCNLWALYGWSLGGDLAGAFFNGVLEAMPETARLTDGDEWLGYIARTEDDYAAMEERNRTGCGCLDETLAEKHGVVGGLAPAFYLDSYLPEFREGRPFEIDEFNRAIHSARAHATGGFIWIYGESCSWWSNDMGVSRWGEALPGLDAVLFNESSETLPAGYTALPYAESDGRQRFNTHVPGGADDRTIADCGMYVEFDFATKAVAPGASFPIVGSWFWPGDVQNEMIACIDGRIVWLDSPNTDLGCACEPNTRYRVTMGGGTVTVLNRDTGTATTTGVNMDFYNGVPIYFYADYEWKASASIKAERLLIKRKENRLGEFVPCATLIDQVRTIGFFNLADNTFRTAEGDSPLTCGCLPSVSADEGLTAEVSSEWVETGASITFTATESGAPFVCWDTPDPNDMNRFSRTFTVAAPAGDYPIRARTAAVVRYVAPGGAGTQDGLSWANAAATAQDVIPGAMEESSEKGGQPILVCMKSGEYVVSGTINGSWSPAPLVVRGGFTGEGFARGGETVVRRPGEVDRIPVVAVNAWFALDSVTVTGGFNIGDTWGDAVKMTEGTVGALLNCRFVDNGDSGKAWGDPAGREFDWTTYYGGAVAVEFGSIVIENCVFENNTLVAGSTALYGGAVGVSGASVRILNSTFRGNSVKNSSDYLVGHSGGGAVYLGGCPSVEIAGCTFVSNFVRQAARYSAPENRNILVEELANGNNDMFAGPCGGTLMVSGCPSAEIRDCTVVGSWNNAGSTVHRTHGWGGTFRFQDSNVTVKRVSVTGAGDCGYPNAEDDYGYDEGGYIIGDSSRWATGGIDVEGGTLRLENVLHAGSRAGWCVNNENAALEIVNCTFADARGEGILPAAAYVQSGESATATIRNTIAWNVAGGFCVTDGAGAEPDVAYCDVPEGADAERHILSVNPKFVRGGGYLLKGWSPCVNAGDNLGWGADDLDLAGAPRVRDGVVDLGAFESAKAGSPGLLLLVK